MAEKIPLKTTVLTIQLDQSHNKAANSKSQAPQTPQQRSSSASKKGSNTGMKEIITYHLKHVECFQKSKFLDTYKQDYVEITCDGGAIVIRGPDDKTIKTVKKKLIKHCDQIRNKTVDVDRLFGQLLSMNSVVSDINKKLNIPNIPVTWSVDVVDGDDCLRVFALTEKDASDKLKQIMDCIKKVEIPMEKSRSKEIKDLLQKESSRFVTTKDQNKNLVVYTTLDIYNQYFVASAANSKCEKGKKSHSPNSMQQGPQSTQKLKGANSDDTVNSPNTATDKQTTQKKPANAAESFHYDENGDPKPDYNHSVLLKIDQCKMKYLEEFEKKKLHEICQKHNVTCEGTTKMVLRGKRADVASAENDLNSFADNFIILKGLSFAGKPTVVDHIQQDWKKQEKDKKCIIIVERCKEPILKSGWIPISAENNMNILFIGGILNLIDADIILCPVDKKLKAIGYDSEVLMKGLNQDRLDRLLPGTTGKKFQLGDIVPLYDPENLHCHCLLLAVFDKKMKNDWTSLPQTIAAKVINTLESSGFRSFGISLRYNMSPEWQAFPFSLLSCVWSLRTKLKRQVSVYCLGEEEEIDSLDAILVKKMKINNYLFPVAYEAAEPLKCKEIEKSTIQIVVEQGSILDYDSKVNVIVNSVSHTLDLNNGIVSKKLVQIAGNRIQEECHGNYKEGINIGEIAVTSPGNMKCKGIYHVALYRYWISEGNISIEILKTLITKCLKEAEAHGITSIAFPALGTGTLGYPPCLVAKAMFAAVDEYGRTNPKYLKQVYFVLFGEQEVFELFKNVDQCRNNNKNENEEFDLPPKHLIYIQSDLDTRVIVADQDYYSRLAYRELKVVLTEAGSKDQMYWNVQDGCFVMNMKMPQKENGLVACFKDLITLMQERKFHTADVYLQNKSADLPMETQLKILTHELNLHRDDICSLNKPKAAGKKQPVVINYVKLVRVFLKSEDYTEVVGECIKMNKRLDENKWKWHVKDQMSFPFTVEVVGSKTTTAEDIFKKVVQDISSIEATLRLTLKVKYKKVDEMKKLIENLKGKNKIHQITLDDDSKLVICEGTQAQIDKVKDALAKYIDLALSYDMSEEDYLALLYITNDDNWRGLIKYKYEKSKGKAVFEVENSDYVSMVATSINSKLQWLSQLSGTEVTPSSKFEDKFPLLQSQVEDMDSENHVYCFLSLDKKRIIIKASNYEQAQQAKYMVEVNLGLVQQGGGRRNRKFASPDEVGPGPVASPSSSSELTIRGGLNFKTREGIMVYVYSAGIGNLKVDTLVNAANKDLMHGGGIAYHISNAAGYALDKECDDYVQSYGPLSIGKCCSTTAGNLPYKSIIHAVGPMWHSYQHDRKQSCLDDLKMTILSALEEAESHRFRSIAIPSISSGIFGVPKELCAKQYYRAVVEYSRNSPTSSVREIHFIDKDRGMCSLIQKTFEKEFGFKGQQM